MLPVLYHWCTLFPETDWEEIQKEAKRDEKYDVNTKESHKALVHFLCSCPQIFVGYSQTWWKQLSLPHQLKALCWINLQQTIKQGAKLSLSLVSQGHSTPLLWTCWFTSIHSPLRKRDSLVLPVAESLLFPSFSSSMELSGVCSLDYVTSSSPFYSPALFTISLYSSEFQLVSHSPPHLSCIFM